MKVILCFFAALSLVPAQDLFPGQAARLVIGQKTFTAQDSGADRNLLGGASGIAYANGMLFVADANRFGASPQNHRVLIYRNLGRDLPPVTKEFAVDDSIRCPACGGGSPAFSAADVVLGQPDFTKTDMTLLPKQNTLRLPTAVASDGQKLVVADTDNNRILIWNSIPLSNNAPADVVIGQADFTKGTAIRPPTNKSLLGPQGVWIQGGKLFVADTQNHRVLIYNTIPTANNATADIVVGQKDFNTAVELDLTKATVDPQSNNLLNPVSVTSDGVRLFVSDLGFNRVLIYNSIPTSNTKAADVVIGQPDFTSAIANNVEKLCPSNGKDTAGVLTYPEFCNKTLQYPRFALSDGKRLFIADGGNDRVLVFNSIPTTNAPTPDVVLGQLNDDINRVSDIAFPLLRASSDQLRTPSSLAWDGTNLFVTDPFNRRVMVFSLADKGLLYNAVRNSASVEVFAQGTITFAGTIRENDEVTVTIGTKAYKYKVKKDDRVEGVVLAVVKLISADTASLVLARPFANAGLIRISALKGGVDGNSIAISTATTPADATITLTTSGATLNGGQDAAKIAPGTLITIKGENLSETTASATEAQLTSELPRELGGAQVYFDGFRAPLVFVSPTQINAQVPFEVKDATSINAWVRTKFANGKISVTSPVAVPIVAQNPGIFADGGDDPRPGVVLHYSSKATGTVSVDGTAKGGDKATIQIGPDNNNRTYTYTVKDTDVLLSIRDGLIALINADTDSPVEAFGAGLFTRIRLRAKKEGPDFNGLVYKIPQDSGGAQVILTATTPALCCANVAGSRVTVDNPALPGETIVVYATGLGVVYKTDVTSPPLDTDQIPLATGKVYTGELLNLPNPNTSFVSSLAGAKTANVLFAGLKQGSIGIYEVHLELNSDLPTNDATEVTIAQDIYVSNSVTFPVKNPTVVVP